MTCFNDLIGLKFEYGGRGPEAYDCWGVVQECMRRFNGIELPDYRSTSSVQQNALVMEQEGERLWKSIPNAVSGSVLLLKVKGFGAHVGFVTSDTRFIHSLENFGVMESRINQFKRQIIGAYEYVGE